MILVAVLVGLGILFAVAAVVAGRSRVMSDPVPDEIDTRVPPNDIRMAAEDIDGLRFRMAFRGYRMDQVDDALDRLREEITVRDVTIQTLQADGGRTLAADPAPVAPAAVPAATVAAADAADVEPEDLEDEEHEDVGDVDEVEPEDAGDVDEVEPEDVEEAAVEEAPVAATPAPVADELPSRPPPEPIQPAENAAASDSALARLRRRPTE
ncbi:MAG: hypothetical protein QOG53_2825 [Frankiales bacterium]|nr:hypothetical protein [Frankiales bacterium]